MHRRRTGKYITHAPIEGEPENILTQCVDRVGYFMLVFISHIRHLN